MTAASRKNPYGLLKKGIICAVINPHQTGSCHLFTWIALGIYQENTNGIHKPSEEFKILHSG